MQSSFNLPALIPMLLPRVPMLLVCLGGLAFAMAHMNSHRKPAVFVLAGSSTLLFSFLISVGSNVLVLQRSQSGSSATEIGAMLAVLGIAQGLLSATGFALLIWAAFVDRPPALPPTRV